MRLLETLSTIFSPVVRSQAELARYLVRATATAVGVALAGDILQQLIFFTDWSTAIRSWVITILIATVIAVPLLGSLGWANLKLWQAKLEVETISRTDELTGLPNRRALLAELDRQDIERTIFVIIDIDHFKRVNDQHGHGIGDTVLRRLGEVLQAGLAGFGLVARLGGEEFALAAHGEDPAALISALERLGRQLAAAPMEINGHVVPVTVSAGAARRGGRDFDAMFHDADQALYAAKHAGRNQLRLAGRLSMLSSGA